MVLALTLSLLLSQAEGDVRAAFEEQLPVPARPLALPAPAAKPSAPGMKVREAARGNGNGKGLALGKEDRDATGQARAAEVRKNMKKPHPPKP